MRYSNGGSGGQPAVTNNKAWKDLISNIPNQVVNEAGNSDLPGKDGGPYDTRATNARYYDSTTGTYKGYTFYSVSIESQRLPFFQTAYDSLKASAYQSLYLLAAGKQLLNISIGNYYKFTCNSRMRLLAEAPIQDLKTARNNKSCTHCKRSRLKIFTKKSATIYAMV